MPNWKKIIQSGSNAELASITSSGNIIPSVDNVHSIGTSNNRFLLNGGTPVTLPVQELQTHSQDFRALQL